MYDHLCEHDLLTKYRSGFRFLHSQFCSCSAVRPVWSSLARFPRFCWQYFSVCTTSPKHSARKTYSLLCLGFWKKFSALQSLFHSPNQIVVCGKPRPSSPASYLKISANIFAIETALIWLVLVGCFFVFLASQKAFVICTRVTEELHSFLSQSELSNFFVYIIKIKIDRDLLTQLFGVFH